MHVDVFVTKLNETVEKITYFTILENCDQDALSTLCVSKHTLQQFTQDFPHINKVYVKTDNAGCYSGNVCGESRYLMAKEMGIKVLRHDYNEPQKGKDQADRESAVAKMFIRTYLCEGHDVASAKDIYDALIFKGRMKNAKVSIIEINKEECFVGSAKIPDIQSYHSVKFEKNEMIFWKYFEIGAGKKIPYSNLEFNCNFQIICPFSSKQTSDKHLNQKSMPLSRKFVNFLFCPEDNCTSSFETADELSLHIARGDHTIPKLISGIDKAKNMFAKRMATITKKKDYFNANSFETVTASSSNEIYSSLISQEGWALKPKRKITRLNKNQKEFLQECFYKGDKTGNKLTAHNVVKMMRGLTPDGKKKFYPEEYLTQEQVMSYFSRMKGKTKNFDAEKDDENEDENEDHDESLHAIIEDNELTERENIRKEMKHFAEKETELHPHLFYAVMFDKRFYIGKLQEDCGNDLFKMKFLHQRGAQEFKWPIRDDIDTVHRSTIFFGPIQLSGADPFTVPCLKDIQESYKEQLRV